MALIRSTFCRTSTTSDVLAGIDLSGKRVVVTGASSGLGAETARALAAVGAAVTLAVRDPAVGAQVAADIATKAGNEKHSVARVDLADLADVRP